MAKAGLSPTKERKAGESVMSEEWLEFSEVHESPLFWIDISSESQLALIQDKLLRIEDRATDLIKTPRRLFQRVKSTLGLK